jgi:hypothetical protein
MRASTSSWAWAETAARREAIAREQSAVFIFIATIEFLENVQARRPFSNLLFTDDSILAHGAQSRPRHRRAPSNGNSLTDRRMETASWMLL